jgi:hypothetical protein
VAILVTTASTGHAWIGVGCHATGPGAGGGRTTMPERIRQSIVVVFPVFLALFTDVARRWF